MHTERINELATLIETAGVKGLGFNMHDWIGPVSDKLDDKSGHDCNTVACMAGWAVHHMEGRLEKPYRNTHEFVFGSMHMSVRMEAQTWLDLDPLTADHLFAPSFIDEWGSITPAVAAAALRHLATTGEVMFVIDGKTYRPRIAD
jgi:hypothetical protein